MGLSRLCGYHLPPLLRPVCESRGYLSLPLLSPVPYSFHVQSSGSVLKWALSISPTQPCPPCSLPWPTQQPPIPGFPPPNQMELLQITLGFCFCFMPCKGIEPWTLCLLICGCSRSTLDFIPQALATLGLGLFLLSLIFYLCVCVCR